MYEWRHTTTRGPVLTETYVAMASEVLQELDLAQSSLGENLLAEDIGNLFDGNTLAGLVVDGSALIPAHVST